MLSDKRFSKLLEQDKRYKPEAYVFVFESLDFAQNRLKLGRKCPSEAISQHLLGENQEDLDDDDGEVTNHITGQDLADAARLYALEMYGFMARVVLENLGIKSTGDLGEIVYNMIKIGKMRKTEKDRREDFDDAYDFTTAFDKNYQIKLKKK